MLIVRFQNSNWAIDTLTIAHPNGITFGRYTLIEMEQILNGNMAHHHNIPNHSVVYIS